MANSLSMFVADMSLVVNGADPETGKFNGLQNFTPAGVPHFTNKGHIAIYDQLESFLKSIDIKMEIKKINKVRGIVTN